MNEQTFFLVWSFDGEVNNGGLVQFFQNDSGNFALETVEALRRIGATEIASILIEAIGVFGNEADFASCEFRRSLLERQSVENKLDKLTARFFRAHADLMEML